MFEKNVARRNRFKGVMIGRSGGANPDRDVLHRPNKKYEKYGQRIKNPVMMLHVKVCAKFIKYTVYCLKKRMPMNCKGSWTMRSERRRPQATSCLDRK